MKGVEAIKGALKQCTLVLIFKIMKRRTYLFFLGPACPKRVEGNEQGRFLSADDY